MLDLSKIEKTLITSKKVFSEWSEALVVDCENNLVGFDVETNGEDFPKTELAGFSMYHHRLGKACYVPINHYQIQQEYNVPMEQIRDFLQEIFSKHTLVTHAGAYDFALMSKLGFKFFNAIDSYLIAVALQCMNLGLKELVLEFGVAKFQDVITYKRLMSVLGFPEDHVNFSVVDVQMCPQAFNYAVNDSIFAYHLAEILYGKYLEYIKPGCGNWSLQAQFDTMLFLAESSATGYFVNGAYLDQFITEYGAELKKFETELMGQVRKEMGWEQK